MSHRIFIAGTDTGVGKTHVSCQLLKQWNSQGLRTMALKPLASGCELTKDGWRNQDALYLQAQASVYLPYDKVNPIALPEPIAPHIAAEKQGLSLSVDLLMKECQPALSHAVDYHIIEGVGGWLTPLNQQETMADFVSQLQAAVILVVGMRLGCLNHALLTYQRILQDNGSLQGWIANCIEPDMSYLHENINTLQQQIHVPLLAVMPYMPFSSLALVTKQRILSIHRIRKVKSCHTPVPRLH